MLFVDCTMTNIQNFSFAKIVDFVLASTVSGHAQLPVDYIWQSSIFIQHKTEL
jgi:hypothetical protein